MTNPPTPAAGTPPISPGEQRTWGTITHVVPLVATVLSAGTLGFVGSLAIFLLYKDRGPFVRHAAAGSLNVQIMTGLLLLFSIPLMLIVIGFATYFGALVWAVFLHLLGAKKARDGQWWSPPLTPRFVR